VLDVSLRRFGQPDRDVASQLLHFAPPIFGDGFFRSGWLLRRRKIASRLLFRWERQKKNRVVGRYSADDTRSSLLRPGELAELRRELKQWLPLTEIEKWTNVDLAYEQVGMRT